MRTCEVLGTGDSGDEWGQVCGRESIGRCYDCAIPACGKHFGCLTFHVKEERITKMGPLGAQSKASYAAKQERPGKDFQGRVALLWRQRIFRGNTLTTGIALLPEFVHRTPFCSA